ncbi:MAG TPA: hypothetical protein VHX63_13500 [Acidobacteriaceae bacterium]|nr:hypothetical protein [Acidobacteriaceae bacterium]
MWINIATATGLLNGPVSLQMHDTAGNGDACLFSYQHEVTMRDLRIAVRDMKDRDKDMKVYESQCRSRIAPLKGIGDEAVLCGVDSRSLHGEQVIGWVRDKIFVVRVDTNAGKDPYMTRDMLQEKVKNAAEQVAGNLF